MYMIVNFSIININEEKKKIMFSKLTMQFISCKNLFSEFRNPLIRIQI